MQRSIVRIERAKETKNRGRWPWTVPQYGLSGISRQLLLDACCRMFNAGIDGEQMAGIFRNGKGPADLFTPTIRALSKVQSVDQRMRLGMRCRLSPTADVPSHTSGAAASPIDVGILLSISSSSRMAR